GSSFEPCCCRSEIDDDVANVLEASRSIAVFTMLRIGASLMSGVHTRHPPGSPGNGGSSNQQGSSRCGDAQRSGKRIAFRHSCATAAKHGRPSPWGASSIDPCALLADGPYYY